MVSIKSIHPPANWKQLKRHRLSSIFGDMGKETFESVVTDMESYGYRGHAVLLMDGEVGDGWHQLRSAILSNKTPTFEQFDGTEVEKRYEVRRRNLLRRHYNESQRAMIAAEMSRPTEDSDKPNTASKEAAPDSYLPSQADTAKEMNVSRSSVQRAEKVIEKGVPELQEAVKDGTIRATDAAKVADEPPAKQRAAVRKVRKGKARTASAAAGKHTGLTVQEMVAARIAKQKNLPDTDTVPCPMCRGKGHISKAQAGRLKFVPPSVEEVAAYFHEQKITNVTAQYFVEFYGSKGWMVGKNKMTDWRLAASRARSWTKGFSGGKNGKSSGDKYTYDPARDG